MSKAQPRRRQATAAPPAARRPSPPPGGQQRSSPSLTLEISAAPPPASPLQSLLEGAERAYKKPLQEPRSGPDCVRHPAFVGPRCVLYQRYGFSQLRATLEIDYLIGYLAM